MTTEHVFIAISSLSAIETGSIYFHNNLLPPGVRSKATQFRSLPFSKDYIYYYYHIMNTFYYK